MEFPITQYALNLVRLKVAEREATHKVPAVASLHDVIRTANEEITAALESLVEQGVLTRSENINRIPMYAPTTTQE